ncbi:ElyC/SanA/YdcF family protein [Candidatus Omnitrophota bacterium]
MFKNENIICISSIDWDFIWQGHQEIMSTLAKNGNKVLFIENTGVRMPRIKDIPRIKSRIKNWFKGVKGIRKETENLYIYSPMIIPFPYSRIARWINFHLIFRVLQRWMKAVDFYEPIIWTFLPTPLSLTIINNLANKLVVYYCVDSLSVSSPAAKKIKAPEIKLLKRVDMVFVASKELHNYCSKYNEKVFTFPFAVSFRKFEQARRDSNNLAIKELENIKRPIIGYIGGVHKWINHDLMLEVAAANKGYSFVFVGPLQTDVSPLSRLDNVYFLGSRKHDHLPYFIKEFNVCIIPYNLNSYTISGYPTKLNEYLAMGKPVISTALPEIVAFNKEYDDVVYVAKDQEEFVRKIKTALDEDNYSLGEKRVMVAKDNSWESRINKMNKLMEQAILKKKTDMEVKWKENLLLFYRVARRKMAWVAILCISLYVLMFRTPFIWFLASPLQISETPQHSDAIVVFGSGVGETGRPGASTIERARYAAQLYKKGYAGKIILSSAYTYVYNDAEDMKLIALSSGVPGRDIILEQKARSTYENVVYSKEILDDHGFTSVLVVSSPYNMRRASLVFNKQAKDIKAVYVPVKMNQFYDRDSGIRLEQMKAIAHEYLGIAYYWIKRKI